MAEKLDLSLLNAFPDLPTVDINDTEGTKLDNARTQKVIEQTEIEEDDHFLGEVDSIADFIGEPVEPVVIASEAGKSENYGIAKMLVAKGYIEDFEDEDFEDSDDWVEDKLTSSLESRAEAVLDPKIKEINDLYKNGGNLNQLIQIQSSRLTLDTLTEEQITSDENLQEALVMNRLEYEGYEEEEAKDLLQTYKDADLLTKEALRAKRKLKAIADSQFQDETKRLEQEAILQKQEEDRRLSTLKTTIENAPSFIQGITMSKNDKSKLFEAVVNRGKDGYTEYERLLMDPDNQLKVLQFLVQLNGDFSKVETKITTKVTKNMKKTVDTYTDDNKNDSAKAMRALDYIKQVASKQRFT